MKLSKPLLPCVISVFVFGCNPKPNQEVKKESNSPDTMLMETAQNLARKLIITDGHIDLPYRLNNEMEDVSVRTVNGDFDYERAKEGGLDAPFMSIYTPAELEGLGRSKSVADSLIDLVENIALANPEKFEVVKSVAETKAAFESGKIALPLGMENGSPIEGKMENLKHFYDRGVRYITLTHSKDNHICDSSYDTTATWNGLSPFGREVVQEMNKLGIMIDVSHISDSTFYQVMELTEAPVIASHSSCRHFTPGFERNMSDDMIKHLAKNGGVVQINFGSTFVDKRSRAIWDHISDYLKENKLDREDSVAKAYIADYTKENPVFSTVEKVAAHIDHVVKLVGVDHVGFGSDFDGVGDTLPDGLKDVSQYPNLIFQLLKMGYSEEDIEKICSGNVFRVWQKVEDIAAGTN